MEAENRAGEVTDASAGGSEEHPWNICIKIEIYKYNVTYKLQIVNAVKLKPNSNYHLLQPTSS